MMTKLARRAASHVLNLVTPYPASWWIADMIRRRLVSLRPLLSPYWVDVIVNDYIQETRYIDKDRIDDELIARFLLASYDYYDPNLDSAVPFDQRISSLLFPHFQRLLQRPNGPKTVLDIGCGNAGFLNHLAQNFPHIGFIGVDFLIPPTSNLKNVRLVKGYALDVLETLGPIDCVFTQFTSVNVLPLELENYYKLFRRIGVKYVLCNEPTRRRARIANNGSSKGATYLGQRMWAHNYPRVATQHGYSIEHFSCRHWSEHIERKYNRVRPDTYIVHLVARSED